MTRRRKFWGWGFEDQQPSHEQVEAAAAGAREHLGFGAGRGRAAGPARGPRASGLRGSSRPPRSPRSAGPIPTSAPRTRTGSPTATSCRAFRGQFDNPPDVVAHPVRRGGARARARLVRGGGRRGDPVRRRHERGRRRGAAGRAPDRDHRPQGDGSRARGGSRRRAPRGSRRGPPGRALEEQLREHGLTLRHFPQSFEYSTLGGWIATRAGGHYATLAHAHRRFRRVGPRAHAARLVGEPAAARRRAPGRARTAC